MWYANTITTNYVMIGGDEQSLWLSINQDIDAI